MRFWTGEVQLAEGATTSWVTITRTGTFHDPRYGEFSITSRMLSEMTSNFEAGVFGQDVFIDLEHDRKPGAAGRITRLNVQGNRLRALVEWTKFGEEAIRERGFRYLSAEFHEAFVDNETREQHGTVLMGAGLTTRPVIKRLDPVELSEASQIAHTRANLLHPELVRSLSQNLERNKMKWLESLRKKLSALGLAEAVVKQLCEAAKAAAKHIGEDEEALKALAASFEGTGKSLADSIGDKEIKLSVDLPKPADAGKDDSDGNDTAAGGKTLSEEDIAKLVTKQIADAEKKAAEQKKKLADTLEARRKTFSDTIEAADGLDDEAKKELTKQAEDLITAEMTEDQCKRLAEFQVSQANKVVAARKLAGLGYPDTRGGSPHISGPSDGGQAKKLSDQVADMLSRTSAAQIGQIRPKTKPSPLAQRVLAEFDLRNAARIDQEVKALAGETSLDPNANLPVAFQRQVILESLSDLNILNLLQQLTDFNASTTVQIPYEERDGTVILNDGVVAEGAGIPQAGVNQKMDTAYVQAMKLAMRLTNEVMHFSVASGINWDAWARNLATNTRIIRELLQRRVANNLQRAADSHLALNISGEAIQTQLDGATDTIKTAQFPIVRQFQQKDISGNNIGSVENPITIVVDSVTINEFDGSGNQAPGTYYRVTDYNLGKVQFVTEAGVPATPSATAATISYSYATNVVKFDTDVPSGTTVSEHFNGLLRAIGARKAVLSADRQVVPDFLLMSPVLEDEATNAKGFVPQTARPGAAADDTSGDLVRIKGIPSFTSNAPGLDLGDSRIIIGQRGVGAYAISRPWQVGQPFEAVNAQGLPTGQKVAYGEEYNAVHVPSPVRDRFTSVIAFSVTNR